MIPFLVACTIFGAAIVGGFLDLYRRYREAMDRARKADWRAEAAEQESKRAIFRSERLETMHNEACARLTRIEAFAARVGDKIGQAEAGK